MPVTIGEFEVVPQAEAPQPAGAPAPAAAPTPPDPIDLQRLLLGLHEQALRTWAH
jgi:hypothetical protein